MPMFQLYSFHNVELYVNMIPYLRLYKPHFWQEFALQNWGAPYTQNWKT
jgi:hypothetical protein